VRRDVVASTLPRALRLAAHRPMQSPSRLLTRPRTQNTQRRGVGAGGGDEWQHRLRGVVGCGSGVGESGALRATRRSVTRGRSPRERTRSAQQLGALPAPRATSRVLRAARLARATSPPPAAAAAARARTGAHKVAR
jgi:hypothetical protein